jgi:hypothetical protein
VSRDYTCITSNCRVNDEWWTGKNSEGNACGITAVPSRNLSEETEISEESQWRYPVSRSRLENSTSGSLLLHQPGRLIGEEKHQTRKSREMGRQSEDSSDSTNISRVLQVGPPSEAGSVSAFRYQNTLYMFRGKYYRKRRAEHGYTRWMHCGPRLTGVNKDETMNT